MSLGYTTLEQSKKLAEILPLESADMTYYACVKDWRGNPVEPKWGKPANMKQDELAIPCANHQQFAYIPCWSVGALIEVMPQSVIDKDGISFGLNINHNFVEYYNPSMGALYATYHSVSAETTLDACYDMVVWLFENGYII
jgi:hypothetical protein